VGSGASKGWMGESREDVTSTGSGEREREREDRRRSGTETRWQTARPGASCSYNDTWRIVVDNMRGADGLKEQVGRRDDSSAPLSRADDV